MIENFNDLFKVIWQAALIFLVLYFLYKKQITSVFDPLFFFLITQAFSTTLALIQIKDFGYLINYLTCQVFFAMGFNLVTTKIKNITIDDTGVNWKKGEYKVLAYFTFFGFLLVVLANIYLISLQGIILFQDDPTSGKVATFESGGGIGAVRRINWGLINLISILTIYLYVKTKKKNYILMCLVLMLIAISGGSKSSLLIYVSIIAIFGLYKSFKFSKTFQIIDRFKAPILFSGLILAVFIVIGNGDLNDALLGLGIRFLYFGDVILYYYEPNPVSHFQKLNFFDFFKYEFNSLLGMMQLVPYLNPIGNDMVIYSFSHGESLDITTGPNLPFYVKGHIFFGALGAIIYSFIVGVIVGKMRTLLFTNKTSNTKIIIVVFLNVIIFSYPQDSGLTLSNLIDTIIFSIIPLFLAIMFTLDFKNEQRVAN